jgi:hypothetical protein
LNTLTDQIAPLLKETGRAHHQAFIATDGVDAEWPLWYADDLQKPLSHLLGRALTKSEIVYLLVLLSKRQPVEAPDADWTEFYAAYIVDQYGQTT